MKIIYPTRLLADLTLTDLAAGSEDKKSVNYHLLLMSFINAALCDAVHSMKSENESKAEDSKMVGSIQRVPIDDLINLYHTVLATIDTLMPKSNRVSLAIYQYNLSMLMLLRSRAESYPVKVLKSHLLQDSHPYRDSDSLIARNAIEKMLRQQFVPSGQFQNCSISHCQKALQIYLSVNEDLLFSDDELNILNIAEMLMSARNQISDVNTLIALFNFLDRLVKKTDRHWNLLLVSASLIVNLSTDLKEAARYVQRIQNILNIIQEEYFDYNYLVIYSSLVQFHIRNKDLVLAEKRRQEAVSLLTLMERKSDLPHFEVMLQKSIETAKEEKAAEVPAPAATSTATAPILEAAPASANSAQGATVNFIYSSVKKLKVKTPVPEEKVASITHSLANKINDY